ncbi:MAG TPA: hypothetical protein ENN25_03595 [Euryarchaeota archaeon]|nr:hypothetical protein [Euryarchaeota archaeon]
MGNLEIPMPDLGEEDEFLESAAKEMQQRIREQVVEEKQESVVVRIIRKEGMYIFSIEYDDDIEAQIYEAIEYPKE